MHAREILELAALASCHGGALIALPSQLPAAGLEQYWTASKSRLDQWAKALKAASQQPAATSFPVFEEILTSELLTRVWTAVLAAHDRAQSRQEAETIARSVLLGHLDARHRALKLLIEGASTTPQESAALNRLRCRAERWSDLLIGHLLDVADVSEFAAHPDRARDFAQQLREQGDRPARSQAWAATLAALRAAFRHGISGVLPNADANARIAASVLACFPHEVFDSTGVCSSVLMMRMTSTATDAHCLIAELFMDDAKPAVRPGLVWQNVRSGPPRANGEVGSGNGE